MKQRRNCWNCIFFDRELCCMYNCDCKAILDEEGTAKNCEHFKLGEYNQDKLEETEYR